MTQTPAQMLDEAASIEEGTHPFFGNDPATEFVRRMAANQLIDRAAWLEARA